MREDELVVAPSEALVPVTTYDRLPTYFIYAGGQGLITSFTWPSMIPTIFLSCVLYLSKACIRCQSAQPPFQRLLAW